MREISPVAMDLQYLHNSRPALTSISNNIPTVNPDVVNNTSSRTPPSTPQRRLDELMESMHDRCQAVIDANGMQTKY